MSVLFISYSHKDEKLKDQLISQLQVLEPEGLIEIWIDDRIPSGADWKTTINDALLQADVAILLVTSNFLTSNFILNTEIPALLKRRQAGVVSLFPLIGRPCAWQEVTWLAQLNVRPKNGVPIWGKDSKTAERYLAEITREIASLIRKPSGTAPDTSAAISSLEKNFHDSLTLYDQLKPREISDMLNNAILHGAPAYNKGDTKACFEIYHHTARRLLTQLLLRLEDMGFSGMRIDGMDYFREKTVRSMPMDLPITTRMPKKESNQMLFKTIIIDLRETLEKIDETNQFDVNSAAWDLRFCFDRILLLIRPLQEELR